MDSAFWYCSSMAFVLAMILGRVPVRGPAPKALCRAKVGLAIYGRTAPSAGHTPHSEGAMAPRMKTRFHTRYCSPPTRRSQGRNRRIRWLGNPDPRWSIALHTVSPARLTSDAWRIAVGAKNPDPDILPG